MASRQSEGSRFGGARRDAGRRPAIAIDGPAAAGKSTIARIVAEALGYLYVDTGAMYRALAFKVLREGIDPEDSEALARLAGTTEVSVRPGSNPPAILLDGEEVTESIRHPDVTRIVSLVAMEPAVRTRLVALQRRLAADGGVVMEGRDIGTHVLPEAEVKIYLTASVRERARRRQEELARLGHPTSLETLQAEIERRDRLDTGRALAPLRQAPDAVVIDTTGLDVAQVAELVLGVCRRLGARPAGRNGGGGGG